MKKKNINCVINIKPLSNLECSNISGGSEFSEAVAYVVGNVFGNIWGFAKNAMEYQSSLPYYDKK